MDCSLVHDRRLEHTQKVDTHSKLARSVKFMRIDNDDAPATVTRRPVRPVTPFRPLDNHAVSAVVAKNLGMGRGSSA